MELPKRESSGTMEDYSPLFVLDIGFVEMTIQE